MNVKKLIELLEKIEDKNKVVGFEFMGDFRTLDKEFGVHERKEVVLLVGEIYIERNYTY